MSELESKLKIASDDDPGRTGQSPIGSADASGEESQVKKLSAELDDLRQTLLRRQADFDNYRKRIEKERTEDNRRATARVVESLIPIVDGFEHALAAHKEDEYASYRKGFELIYKQLLDNLAKLGVERSEPLAQLFDPHLHQAVDRTETAEHPDGTILEVFQPSYVFHGRVLRPALVRVAVHPGGASNRSVN
ncbi:MAG TPA: nucleotide exchange factor GrpE [Candidatus Acidoferrum sp.]|nr:nucleotide exchange factor GrpE [Candidatus Acidoferrum sp.]